MAYCGLIKANLGLGSCPTMPGYFRGMITTPDGFKIPAATIASGTAAVKAYIQDAILDTYADRIYKWPLFFSNEDQSTETVYQTTVLGKRFVDAGFYEWLINFSNSLCSHKSIYTHVATGGRVIFYDGKNYIGTTNEDGDFLGFTLQMLQPEKMKLNTGTEVAMTPVRIVLGDSAELDQDGYLLPALQFNTIQALTSVSLTIIGSPSATTIVVSVLVSCDGTPLNGLVAADFSFTGGAISSLAEVDGVYTLTGTGLATGSLNLDAPGVLSIDGYESTGAVTVTIA